MRVGLFLGLVSIGCSGSTVGIDGGNDATMDTSASDTSTPDYGTCGKAAHDCLCACDGGAGCQNTCWNMFPMCLMCVNDSVTGCCPNEYPAWLKCIADSQKAMDGGPTPCAMSDIDCQNMRCMAQAAALQNCLGTSACKTGRAKCTGACQ